MPDAGPLLVVLGFALLLGIRHAGDPDHLAAVSAALAAERGNVRRAAALGLAWGAGHALTVLALGIPVILHGDPLPATVVHAAELAVGILIIALALRLLRGAAARPARSRLQACGIGLVHGAAGSAGAVVLVLAVSPDPAVATASLGVFAAGSAVSMALLSLGLGRLLDGRVARVVQPLGLLSLAFGAWYALAALP